MIRADDTDSSRQTGQVESFDYDGGSFLERALFNHRIIVVAAWVLITTVLALSIRYLTINTSFESFVPSSHPFVVNNLKHRDDVRGISNVVRVIVESRHGTIFTPQYLETLKQINDEVFLYPGVDRAYMRSLWTPATRWLSVTAEGMDGGPVMPFSYDGTATSIEQLQLNVMRSGEIGQLVASDFKSSIIRIPLLDIDQDTGKPLDYADFAHRLDGLRSKFQDVDIRIVGFAEIVGDLITGLQYVAVFFAVSILISVAFLYWFTRCARSTALVVICSLTAVIWQLGLLPILGYHLDPYSVLVPFLIFAIGMSHGAQKMNGVMQDIGRGMPRLVAARMTFRRLFLAGFTALVCDAVGFAVMLIIDIPAIRQLAIIASVGVAILIFTNLIVVPILLSYIGVSSRASLRSLRAESQTNIEHQGKHVLWRVLDVFTRPRYAIAVLGCALLLGIGGAVVGAYLRIGDLDAGAPELRTDSRYNRDNAYFIQHYAISTDIFVIMAETKPGQCAGYEVLAEIDSFEQQLRELPGVETSQSLAGLTRQMSVAMNEGSFAWYDLVPNQQSLNQVFTFAPRELYNTACSLVNVFVYLRDHKAETLSAVVAETQRFAAAHNSDAVNFQMAAGNAGMQAATNIVVAESNRRMLLYIYLAVILLSFATFRSFRAIFAAILPLMLTSVLAEAVMVFLGIGVKVATLPVAALGVGIGVDYALYILTVTLTHLRRGASLSDAYYRALLFTGSVVMLTGFTLAAAVATWALSPIKFQADMGVLLAFMFLLNMIGAMVLLPALACFLLRPRGSAIHVS